jgi:hypothetical protein
MLTFCSNYGKFVYLRLNLPKTKIMKKTFTLLALAIFASTSFNSCDTYHSLSEANSVRQLSSNPFMQNVAKSVIKNMGSMLVQNGIKNAGKLGLNTDLKSILTTANAVSGLKAMLTSNYGVAANVVEKNYSKLNTVRDIIGLVAASGTKGLNFYNF